jgi:hypothetical protein
LPVAILEFEQDQIPRPVSAASWSHDMAQD